MSQEELISGRDGELALMLKNNVVDTLKPYGIEIVGVETKRIDLPDENKKAVYENQLIQYKNARTAK